MISKARVAADRIKSPSRVGMGGLYNVWGGLPSCAAVVAPPGYKMSSNLAHWPEELVLGFADIALAPPVYGGVFFFRVESRL